MEENTGKNPQAEALCESTDKGEWLPRSAEAFSTMEVLGVRGQ